MNYFNNALNLIILGIRLTDSMSVVNRKTTVKYDISFKAKIKRPDKQVVAVSLLTLNFTERLGVSGVNLESVFLGTYTNSSNFFPYLLFQ